MYMDKYPICRFTNVLSFKSRKGSSILCLGEEGFQDRYPKHPLVVLSVFAARENVYFGVIRMKILVQIYHISSKLRLCYC